MNPWWLVLGAFCITPLFYAYVAVYQLTRDRIRRRRAQREATKRRHPSSQSVASYLVAPREMPPELRALVIAEIAKAHADRIDEEWAAISRAVSDE